VLCKAEANAILFRNSIKLELPSNTTHSKSRGNVVTWYSEFRQVLDWWVILLHALMQYAIHFTVCFYRHTSVRNRVFTAVCLLPTLPLSFVFLLLLLFLPSFLSSVLARTIVRSGSTGLCRRGMVILTLWYFLVEKSKRVLRTWTRGSEEASVLRMHGIWLQ
jgi:hypothetical protein